MSAQLSTQLFLTSHSNKFISLQCLCIAILDKSFHQITQLQYVLMNFMLTLTINYARFNFAFHTLSPQTSNTYLPLSPMMFGPVKLYYPSFLFNLPKVIHMQLRACILKLFMSMNRNHENIARLSPSTALKCNHYIHQENNFVLYP